MAQVTSRPDGYAKTGRYKKKPRALPTGALVNWRPHAVWRGGKNGSGSRTRTCDQSVNSRPLYQLSYPGMGGGEVSRQGALVKGGAGPHGATRVGMRAAGRATPRGGPTRKRGPHAAPALRDYVRSMPRNTAWHQAHPMTLEATVEERLTWYVAHAHHCACRPMPRDIEDLARERKLLPRRRHSGVRRPAC